MQSCDGFQNKAFLGPRPPPRILYAWSGFLACRSQCFWRIVIRDVRRVSDDSQERGERIQRRVNLGRLLSHDASFIDIENGTLQK